METAVKPINDEILSRARQWAENDYFDEASRKEIQILLDAGDKKELADRFSTELEFGTGGIRGVVGAGINRMNVYNVRKATQGLTNYAKEHFASKIALCAVICHDSRNTSALFAEETARVMTANNVAVYMFSYPSATPLHSFAIRHFGAHFGVNITASHNPPEYNGYKVFWDKGEQVVAPVDAGIIKQVNAITDYGAVRYHAGKALSITPIGDDITTHFYNAFKSHLPGNPKDNADIHILYSPLHGVGYKFIKELAMRRNFKNIEFVKSQYKPDGRFPTINTPNPEEHAAYDEALKQATPATDLIVTTDPDADRIGCMAKDKSGRFGFISGNHVGCIMLHQILKNLKNNATLTSHDYIVTTPVSTPLAEIIAARYGVNTFYCHTGFKNIAKVINEKEMEGTDRFIFGFEESHGYMIGDYVRDKDGLSGLIALGEIAATLKKKGKTLLDALDDIFGAYGFYVDEQKSFSLKGLEGKKKINSLMSSLRNNPPKTISGNALTSVSDYKSLKNRSISTNVESNINFQSANMLAMNYGEHVRITVRPSGTEPKIKFYITVNGDTNRNTVDGLLKRTVNDLTTIVDDHLRGTIETR